MDLFRCFLEQNFSPVYFPISYSARVSGHEVVVDDLGREHVVYVIEVERSDSPVKYTVYRRWSKFVMVDKLLESEFGVPRTTSRFPSWRRGTDEKLISERKQLLNILLEKFLLNFCDVVSEFLRIPSQEESRYDFSAVSSSVVTSGIQTPLVDDSDEGLMIKLRHEIRIADSSGKAVFPVFINLVKANPISLGRNQSVAVDFLSLLLERTGTCETNPTDSLNFLKFLAQTVSAEQNPSEYAIAIFLLNHKVSANQWAKADLGFHVTRIPSPFGNRLDVFRIIFALDKDDVGLQDLGIPEIAVSQYLMWRDRHVSFAEVLPAVQAGESYVSPGMVSLMGPNSPLAASPSRSSRNQTSAANDAREWLMVSLAALEDDGIFASNQTSWTKVSIPEGSKNLILGDVSLWYRPSSESQTEVKFEWTFPANVNMEHVLGLLFNPEEIGAPLDLVSGFFGLVSSFTLTQAAVDEDDVLLKKLTVYFDEPRKAMAHLVVSVGRGVGSNAVVLALASDTTISRSVTTHRLIRSFHLGGCEINVTTGQMKGLINFSSDSIFLIAGDLLGERLVLWKAFERFSSAVRDYNRVHEFNNENPMSCWLRSQFPPSSNS